MKFAIWMVIAAAVLMVFVGCSDDDDNGATPSGNVALLNGTWTAVSATQDGTTVSLDTALDLPEGAVTQRLTFNTTTRVVTVTNLDASGNVVSTQTGTFTAQNNGRGTITLNGVTTTFEFDVTGATNSNLAIRTRRNGVTTVVNYTKTGVTPTGSLINGTWLAIAATQNGNVVPLGATLGFGTNVVSQTISFDTTTGNVTINSFDAVGNLVNTRTGTFTVNNGSGTITFDNTPTNFTFTTSGTNNTILRITSIAGATTTVITYVKTTAVNPTGQDAALVGNWTITAAGVNGTNTSLADFFQQQGTTIAYVTFNSNGTGSITLSNGSQNLNPIPFNWTASNGIVRIIVNPGANNTLTWVGTYTTSGNTANFVLLDQNGRTITLTTTKI